MKVDRGWRLETEQNKGGGEGGLQKAQGGLGTQRHGAPGVLGAAVRGPWSPQRETPSPGLGKQK